MAERGWVTAVRAAVSWGLGGNHRGASLEEWRSAMGRRQCEEEGCDKRAVDGTP
jgi:hypothetical protein